MQSCRYYYYHHRQTNKINNSFHNNFIHLNVEMYVQARIWSIKVYRTADIFNGK